MEWNKRHPNQVGAPGAASVAIGGDNSGQIITNPNFDAAATPLVVAIKDVRKVFSDVGVSDFTGRDWLINRIDGFISNQRCGFLWIEGEAGVGKTALAARLVHNRGYISHFARHSHGDSIRVGLQNLAAQLISRYSLTDFAPGGMIPSWITDSAGFEALLGRAAEAAHADGDALVIIIDGADEAETSHDGMPWGLPSLLPEGVYIVGTYRTGYVPPFPSSPSESARLDKADDRNLSDLRTYVSRALREKPLATALSKAPMSDDELIELLTYKTGGVWVYLRYILAEIRTGQRLPAELTDLPTDLSGYYGEQVRRWRMEHDWNEVGSRLLSTLVAAGEPLTFDTLVRLADLDEAPRTRHWCDILIRPFLTVDTARTFQVYHASAREYFGGSLPPGVEADHFHATALDLKKNALSAHLRIANYYLRQFGTLFGSLPALGADPALAQNDSGYPLRNLVSHLLSAEQASLVHDLLTCRHPPKGINSSNVWFTAHEQAGTLDAYLVDVERARNDAERQVDLAVDKKQSAGNVLVKELRCLLLGAATLSFTDSVGRELLTELIDKGVWTSDQGIAHARRLTDSEERYKALLALYPYASPAQRDSLIEESLTAVKAAGLSLGVSMEEGVYVTTPAHILPFLSEQRRAEVVDEILGRTPEPCVEELILTLPHIAAEARTKYTETALRIIRADSQPGFTEELETYRLIHLSVCITDPHVHSELISRAINTACDAAQRDRGRSLRLVIPHAPGDQRDSLVQKAIEAARGGWNYTQAGDLAELLPLIPVDQQQHIAREALDATDSAASPDSRIRSLSLLLPYFPEKEREGLIEEIKSNVAVADHHTIARLSPFLSSDALKECLSASRRAAWGGRIASLSGLLDYLPAEKRETYALRVMAEVDASTARVRCVVGAELLRHLSDAQRKAMTWRLLEMVRQLSRPLDRAHALSGLVENGHPDYLDEVSQEVYKCWLQDWTIARGGLFVGAAKKLSQAVLEEMVQKISPNLSSSLFLVELFPALSPPLATKAFASLCEGSDPQVLGENICRVAQSLPSHLVNDALNRARKISDAEIRAQALAALVPQIADEQRLSVAKEAVETARECWYGEVLAEYFVDDEPRTIEHLCEGIAKSWRRTPRERERLFSASFLLPYLPENRQTEFAMRAMSEIRSLSPLSKREFLYNVVPYLPISMKGEMVEACQGDGGKYYARVSEVVIPVLSRAHEGWGLESEDMLDIIRRTFPGNSLTESLKVVISCFPLFAQLVGSKDLEGLVEMVVDIVMCWPE